jgi:hypothetical protein
VVLVAVFGVVFLGERLSAPNWLGIALIAVGAGLVVYRWARRGLINGQPKTHVHCPTQCPLLKVKQT